MSTTQITKAEQKRQDQAHAAGVLKSFMAQGSTVYTDVTHVSRSGMSRSIKVLVVSDGEIVNLSGFAASALGWARDHRNGGVKVSGAGMDMGFHLVYTLSMMLYEDQDRAGYALKQRWI